MQIVQNRPNRRDGIVEELIELCHLCGVIGYNIYVSPQMLWGRCAAALLRLVRAVLHRCRHKAQQGHLQLPGWIQDIHHHVHPPHPSHILLYYSTPGTLE